MSDKNEHHSYTLRSQSQEAAESLPALRAAAENAVASVLHGEHAQSKPGTGEKFWQYREYVQGDRPQDIDWRQTAKNQAVFIKQKEWQTTQSVIFWCCQNTSMRFQSPKTKINKLGHARILTLAIAILMTKAGELVGSFGSRKVGRSQNAIEDLELKLTEDIRSYETLPDPQLYTLPQHASFIQIGDFLEPLDMIEDNFKQFSGQTSGGLIVQVLDPAELDLPYEGRILFQGMNRNDKQQIDNVASIRKAYRERIEAHNRSLQQLCKEHGWHFFQHRTDAHIEETLANIWSLLTFGQTLTEGEKK